MKSVICPKTGEITEYDDDEFFERKTELLKQWQAAKLASDQASGAERRLREEYAALVGNPAKTKGTEWDDIGNRWRCKIVKTANLSFRKNEANRIDTDAITAALREIADNVDNGAEVAGELVRWIPSLALGVYDKLDKKAKSIINKVVIEGQSYIKLEIVPPKEKK